MKVYLEDLLLLSILSDGSMLLSDDKANVIYRITYEKLDARFRFLSWK